MRIVQKILASLIAVISMSFVCGCGGGSDNEGIKGTIQVAGEYTISEFDMETGTIGNEVTNNTVKCGKNYILRFDFDFKNLEEVAGDSIISTMLQVQLGVFDNDMNLWLYDYGEESRERGDFHRIEDGLWEVDFDFSSTLLPDFSQFCFILSVDSWKEEMVNLGEIIAFSFISEVCQFKINGLNEMQIPLSVEKGTFDFTEENNVTTGHVVVKVPENCKKINVIIYEDEEHTQRRGVQTYFGDSFYGDALVVTIDEETIEYIKKGKTLNQEGTEEFVIYLEIVAEGGDSYENAIVNTEIVIE